MSVPILKREELLDYHRIFSIFKDLVNSKNEIQIIDSLKQQCGTNGVSKRLFDKLIKQVKQEIEEQNKPVAQVEDGLLPSVIKNVGEEYSITEKGIYVIAGTKYIEVCPHPIFPVEIMRDIDTGEEKVRIEFKRKGVWHTDIIMDRYDIATTRGIVKLSNYGVLVNDQNAGYLVKFFCDIEKYNEDSFNVIKATSTLGYTTNGEFIPYSANVIYNNNNADNVRRFALYKEHGDFDIWLNAQIKIFDYVIPKIIIAAGYVSLIIEKIGINPFGIHLWGETGLGKSVAMLTSASIYGYPDIKNGIVYTGNATANGIESRLAFVKNCAFYLDELSILSQKQIDDMIYLIMQGQGKARMTRGGNSRDTYYWNLVSVSNSEMPITNDLSKGGIFNRIIQIGVTDNIFGNTNLPDLANTFKDNYGFGASRFLELIKDKEIITTIIKLKKEYYSKVIKHTEDKQANSAALLLATFEVVRKHIYKTDKQLTAEELIPYLHTSEQISQVLRAYNKLIDWLQANYRMFDDKDLQGNGQKWGNITTTNDGQKLTNILPFKFTEFCNFIQINERQFLLGLRQHNLIKATNGFKNVVRFNEDSARVISVMTSETQKRNKVITSPVFTELLEDEENCLPF